MSQLNDQTEQQLFNGFTAESADELQSQFEKQVYNAFTAAGGGGGGGTGELPELTKERVIGTLNGKNVYEKTFEGTTPSTSTATKTLDLSEFNISKIIDGNGTIHTSDDNFTSVSYYASTSSFCFIQYAGSDKYLYMAPRSAAYQKRPFVIKLQYQKTTD